MEHEHEAPAPRTGGPAQHREPPSQGAGPLDPAIGALIDAERGGGSALPGHVLGDLEPRLGADLSAVRVHTGPRAEALNRAVRAEAFTVGNDVFFGGGHGDPAGGRARELLVHELTHVVQQNTGATGAGPAGGQARVSAPDEPAEVEARDVARAVVTRQPVPNARAVAPGELLRLQAMAGNAAVQRLVSPGPPQARDPVPVTAEPVVEEAPRAQAKAQAPDPGPGPAGAEVAQPDAPAGGVPVPERAESQPPARARAVEASPEGGAAVTDRLPESTVAEVPAASAIDDLEDTAAGPGTDGPPAFVPAPPPPAAPPPAGAGDEPLAAVVIDASAAGQARVDAATTAAFVALQQASADERVVLDQTADAQQARIRATEAQARQRVQHSVASASGTLRAQAIAQQQRLAQARVAQAAQATAGVERAAGDARALGVAAGDEAVTLAADRSTAFRNQVGAQAQQAEATGQARAAAARDENPEAVAAMRRAASQIAGQTAVEVRKAVGVAADDMRDLGPEVRGDFVRQSTAFSEQIDASLGPLTGALNAAAMQGAGSLDRVLTEGMASLTGIGTATVAALAGIRRSSLDSLRVQQTTARQAQHAATERGAAAIGGYADAMRIAGQGATDAILTQMLSRSGRRRLSRAMAEEAAAQLQRNYGISADRARTAGEQIGAAFRSSAAALSRSLVEVGDDAERRSAEEVAHAVTGLSEAQSRLAVTLQRIVTDTVADGAEKLESADRDLQEKLAMADDGLRAALDRLGAELDRRSTENLGLAGRPLADLGGRIDAAMQRARQRANDGWLLDQLRQAGAALSNPAFWVGLVVGLLVTVAVVAICGTGIGALILAGALAGAASAGAGILTEHATGKRKGPVDTDELVRVMLVGAAFGAVGGAVGAGASAGVLGRQVLSGTAQATARQVMVDRLAQVVVGSGSSVVQNVLQGPGVSIWDPNTWTWSEWDKELLLNVAVNAAMSNRHAEKLTNSLNDGARAAAVDRGIALRVTEAEKVASGTRLGSADAGPTGDVPVAGVEPTQEAPAGGVEPTREVPVGPTTDTVLIEPPGGVGTDTRPVPTVELEGQAGAAGPGPGGPGPATAAPDIPLIDMPTASAGMLHGPDAFDPAANRQFFENFVTESPYRESALLRNDETGLYVVVQGAEDHVPINVAQPEQLVPPELLGRGSWVLEAHSHPVDPGLGHTSEANWLPSGAGADFGIVAYEAAKRNAPFHSDIRIETPAGPDLTRFGYEPGVAEPYLIDLPKAAGGREVLRFATIEDYHDWYRQRFGGDLGAIPDWFPGDRRSEPATSVTAGGPEPATAPDAVPDPSAPLRDHALMEDLLDQPGISVRDEPASDRAPSAAELDARLAELRRRLDRMARVRHNSGSAKAEAAANAARLRAGLEAMVASGDPEHVRLAVESTELALAREPSLPRGETVEVNLADGGELAALQDAFDATGLAGVPEWDAYVALVLDHYAMRGTVDVGPSPRSDSQAIVAGTDNMRRRFLAEFDPEATDGPSAAVREHLERAVARATTEDRAVELGDAVWVRLDNGAKVDAPGPGVVLWPAGDTWGVWWVDHIVELRHGGADAAHNYVAVPQRMHSLKTGILGKLGRVVSED